MSFRVIIVIVIMHYYHDTMLNVFDVFNLHKLNIYLFYGNCLNKIIKEVVNSIFIIPNYYVIYFSFV